MFHFNGVKVISDERAVARVKKMHPIPPSRHRSKRVWKKLKRRNTYFVDEPTSYLFKSDNTLMMHPVIYDQLRKHLAEEAARGITHRLRDEI